MTGRYFFWLIPAAFMAVAAAGALGIWGTPVDGDLDGSFSEFDLEGGDKFQDLATMNRPGLPIEIDMDATTFELMRRVDNRKLYKDRAVNVTVRFGESGEVRRYGVLTLRGRGSLRNSSSLPNYDVNLIRPVAFADGVKMKRLFLMNLHYDPHHLEMTVAYRLLAELGLFPLHFQFIRLTVAEQNHGIYLLVEPPVPGLRRAHPDCVAVFRRLRPNGYDVEWTASVPGVRTSLNRLQALALEAPGESDSNGEFGESLNEPLYFRWLAVNALLKNADTLDELFLYERRAPKAGPAPLQVLAWDYDDIIGKELKEGALSNPLLFGCLDPLERKIAADPNLYLRYRESLRTILTNELSLERVEKIVREMQSLRDGLDDGTSSVEQRRARKHRADYAETMLSSIRQTHGVLTGLTNDL